MEDSVPSRAKSRRSPGLAAFLSFLWPGLGQLYARRPRWAALFAIPAFVIVVLGVRELLVKDRVTLAFSLLDPSYALSLTLLVVVVGIWRGWAVLDAFVAGFRGRSIRSMSRSSAAWAGLLLVGILVMHLVPAYYTWSVYQLDSRIQAPVPSDTAWQPVETPDPSSIPNMSTPVPGATAVATAPPFNADRVTILLTGVDFGPGRQHALTDTMLLVSFDTVHKTVGMVSVPRDTTMFPLYWNNATLGTTFKLNAFTTGIANKWFTAPDKDPFMSLAKEVGYIAGVRADYYAVVDLLGFSRMIDMVGGVDVVNPRAFFDALMNEGWPAGKLHLDGDEALRYVRSRHGDNDYARASRQQDVMIAVERKLVSPDMIVRLPEFLSVAGDSIRTNFPLEKAKDMASVAQGISDGDIKNCVLGPPYSFHPDSATTKGVWTSQLRMDRVANLSVYLFGEDSRYNGQSGLKPAACGS